MPALIDTHCHLDAAEFDGDREDVVAEARRAGVGAIVVPAVSRAGFESVRSHAASRPGCFHALGIHPLYVGEAAEGDLDELRRRLAAGGAVAVGEIGLDFFVEGHDRARQEWFFAEQLKLAREAQLPVLLHLRRAQDTILKHLRRIPVAGGIAHAFNGSWQQAQAFLALGFKLGFGGAMTWDRALRLRELAARLPWEAIVLETDAPDMPPAWARGQRNTPAQLARIAQCLAGLRGVAVRQVIERTSENACAVLPALARARDGIAEIG